MFSQSLNSGSSTLGAIHFLTKGREVAWIWYWRGGQKFRILSWSFMNSSLQINNWWKISNVPKHPVETVASLLDPHPSFFPLSACLPRPPSLVYNTAIKLFFLETTGNPDQGRWTTASPNPLKLCGHKDTTWTNLMTMTVAISCPTVVKNNLTFS